MLSVIWDMDGVLLDTEPIYLAVEGDLVARYGGPDKSIETVLPKLLGRRADEASEITVSELELSITLEDYLTERNAELLKRMPSCKLLPGVLETITHLKKHGVKCAIATSSPKYLLEAKRRGKDDFFALFDALVCGDDVVNGKPDPEIFLNAAKSIGADPSNCVVFEDAPAGIKAAVAAGMKCVALPNDKVDIRIYQQEAPTFTVPSACLFDFDLSLLGLPKLPK